MQMDHPQYLELLDEPFRFIDKNNDVTSLVNLTSYTSEWPDAERMGLNASQYLAFKSALTQEFSIIQGILTCT